MIFNIRKVMTLVMSVKVIIKKKKINDAYKSVIVKKNVNVLIHKR